MSSNGLVLFLVTAVGTLFVPTSAVVPGFSLALGLAFTFRTGRRGFPVLWRALVTVLPLAAFLVLVWVVIVGRAPDGTLLFSGSATASAWSAVAAITAKLFLMALFTLAVVQSGAALRPSFVSGLLLPKGPKVVLLAAASFAGAMRQGAQSAQTALVASNILSPRMSIRNLLHGWLLFRTTWVAAVGIAVERMDTKWLYEDLPATAPVDRADGHRVLRGDLAWISTAAAILLATLAFRRG